MLTTPVLLLSDWLNIIKVTNFSLSVSDNGYVLKTVNADSADTIERVSPVVIEEIQVFPSNVSVRTLRVVRGDNTDGRLVVVSDNEVLSIRLHRCDKVVSGCRLVTFITPFSRGIKQ